jgi:hypothetical protein
MSETDAPIHRIPAPVSERNALMSETDAPIHRIPAPVSERNALMSEMDAPIHHVYSPTSETDAGKKPPIAPTHEKPSSARPDRHGAPRLGAFSTGWRLSATVRSGLRLDAPMLPP